MTRQAPVERRLEEVRASIEYTDLRKTITYRDVETMCTEALHYGLGVVVVPSALVRQARTCVSGGACTVCTVISYPFGTQSLVVKAREAAAAVEQGACELDVVPHFGAILSERWTAVREELSELHRAAEGARLKLVLEAGQLAPSVLREACAIAAEEGFQYVVNTTGFRIVSTDPDAEGCASVEIVRSLRGICGDGLKIKAAGGITRLDQATELLDAGADSIAVAVFPGALRQLKLVPREGGAG